ncbi:Stk1 family PASTA domain-containing Ser/Thr kinase [Actinotalea sp.]|uniref:Stk1 family PASTA domain-containing Ser/Thr kinase n=1 Tax=Actinotalea sp. TaxID=1872145 RepID=UPI003567D578
MDDAPRILGGRYEVGELIGRGGMAEVHIGHDTRLGRTVAIKILRSDLARDPSFQARFRREAQAAASLNHPAVVAVYDTGEDVSTEPGGAIAHVPFIVMEYVEGHTVRDILRDGAAVPIEEAVEITAGVLSALEYSHRAGIVHRDIKPANVMLTPTGAVKVMDFGIARAMADAAGTMTQTQAVIGTAQYLSPEQARGEQVDARSDLYSTGCLLFELLTGRPPFIGDSPVAVAYQHAREEAQPPTTFAADVPEALDRITMKALAKDRENRYRTAAEFRNDLEAVLRGGAVSAPAVGALAAETAVLRPPMADPGPPTAATQVLGATPGPAPATSPWGPVGRVATPVTTPATTEPPATSRRWLLWTLIAVAVLAIGGIIALLVANADRGPDQVTVPDVASMEQEAARAALEELGLTVSPTTEPSTTIASGLAIRTDPAGGESVDVGSTVSLVVSSGAEAVTLEDLEGYTPDAAVNWLVERGFPRSSITRTTEDSGEVEKDKVIRTDPAAGESVDPTTQQITIYVSTGQVQLKDYVTSQTPYDEAVAELEALGLTVVPAEAESADAPPGTVIAQQPSAGPVNQRSVVTLTKAIAPTVETVAVPGGLIGMTCTDALNALGSSELNGRCEQSDGTQAAGQWVVISADPGSGTIVNVGDLVTLVAEEPAPDPDASAGTGGSTTSGG